MMKFLIILLLQRARTWGQTLIRMMQQAIRINNVTKVIIGTLNIYSLPPKFEQLKLIISNYIDVFVIQETKLDPSFTDEHFWVYEAISIG